MIFDLARLEAFLSAAEDTLAGVRFYASVALLRSAHMAERACALPGVAIPRRAVAQISRGGGIDLAGELAAGLCQHLARGCASRISARSRSGYTRGRRGVPRRAGVSVPCAPQGLVRNRNRDRDDEPDGPSPTESLQVDGFRVPRTALRPVAPARRCSRDRGDSRETRLIANRAEPLRNRKAASRPSPATSPVFANEEGGAASHPAGRAR